MGLFDLSRGRKDARAEAVAGTEIYSNETDHDVSASDSDTMSLEAKNEKEIELNPNEVTAEAQLGIQKAEAAALTWSKPVVYATYIWYVRSSQSSPVVRIIF